MARKSSFTIRAQKRIWYTDEGEAEEEEERHTWRDGTYVKFKRDIRIQVAEPADPEELIYPRADRNKIIRPEEYYRYSET